MKDFDSVFVVAVVVILFCFGAANLMADEYNREVIIRNNTGETIVSLYASHVDSQSWEEDMLGRGVLPPWSEVVADIDDGSGYCLYDLRVIYENGENFVRAGVNVCEVSLWTIFYD